MNLIAIVLLAVALPGQASLKNPVVTNDASVTDGSKLYSRYCTACHGSAGKGDGAAGAKLNPKPSNLSDAEWKHGPSDGEIFAVIHDGAKGTGMKGFASRMTERELWDLVNYIRSLKKP